MSTMVIDRELQRKSRIKLLGVLFIFAGPLLVAFIWLQLVRHDAVVATSSKGDLIKPATPLTEFQLEEVGKGALDLESVKGLWTLMYFAGDTCGDICRQNLYHMRQVRLALARNMDRVQRLVITAEAATIDADLLSEHEGLRVATGSADAVDGLRQQVVAAEAGMTDSPEAIYLIDPMGNVMLRFPADLNPKGMLKDLKHLMKVSRIG